MNRNPFILMIKAIIAKWYIIVVLASFSVLYSTYTAFNDAGLIKAAEAIFLDALGQIKGTAQNCMPKITNLTNFWNCLGNPASFKYRPNENDAQLEEAFGNNPQDNNAGNQ